MKIMKSCTVINNLIVNWSTCFLTVSCTRMCIGNRTRSGDL